MVLPLGAGKGFLETRGARFGLSWGVCGFGQRVREAEGKGQYDFIGIGDYPFIGMWAERQTVFALLGFSAGFWVLILAH